MSKNVVVSASNLTLSYGQTDIIKDASFSIKRVSLYLLQDLVVVVNQLFLNLFMVK